MCNREKDEISETLQIVILWGKPESEGLKELLNLTAPYCIRWAGLNPGLATVTDSGDYCICNLKNKAGHPGQFAMMFDHMLSGGKSSVFHLPLPVHVHRGKTFSCDKPQSAKAAITLKVKSEDGSRTYVVRMHLSETVGQLRSYLDKHRWEHIFPLWERPSLSSSFYNNVAACPSPRCRGAGQPGYDIISAYPPHSFNDDSQTLRSCGLLTNAALLLRKGQRGDNTGRRQ